MMSVLNNWKNILFNRIKYCSINFKMWKDLILDIVTIGDNNFYIFSNQSWHYGWDYESRKLTYKKIFSEKFRCIFLDLNNSKMVNFFYLILKIKKNKFSIIDNSKEILEKKLEIFNRNFWDHDKNLKLFFPTKTSNEYNHMYEKWKKENLRKNIDRINKGDKLFSCNKFKGLIVSQFGYEDWAWASISLLNDKHVYSPEANFGFTKLTGSIEDKETVFVKEQSKKLNYTTIRNGYNSLNARCKGQFKNSALSYYMSDVVSTSNNISVNYSCNFVFYLHAFGDSPNNTISDYKNTFGLDYFHSTLKILEYFEKSKKELAIKFHPLSKQYNYDKLCNKIIKKFVENSKYIKICDNFSLAQFNEFYPNASILTGRGSIISEASFLGLRNFSFCKSIYTELGMSTLFYNIDSIFSNNTMTSLDKSNMKKWAVRLESVRLMNFGTSVYFLSNYNKESKRINELETLEGFLDSNRIVNL